jgi:hypothetical protein
MQSTVDFGNKCCIVFTSTAQQNGATKWKPSHVEDGNRVTLIRLSGDEEDE